ncbi:hypothetical protein EYC80_002802 [Monilinia laxa]|uniref:Uncharacterized protein n=1 Tax=Monilinia laxa TaxID=61186 RepID=A0A5N6KBX9_MONLA|nr:hypothetical protein EYC80_002802 [Monilinia laxa]
MTQQPPGPSANARKYGPWKRNPNISGLTPLPSLFPQSTFDREEQNTRTRIEKFQRRILHTFTARELANLDVITDRELTTPNLDNPVMPMLRQNRWEIRPSQPQFTRDNMYPLILDGEAKGEWSMHNPLVFEIMKPILRLATRTLNIMYTLPWFGALLFGDRFPIDERRKRPADVDKISRITTSFHPYKDFNQEKVQVRMEKVFDDLEKIWNLTFGFMMPNKDPRGSEHDDDDDGDDDSNDKEDNEGVHGICVTNYGQMKYTREKDQSWGVWIFLNYKQVEALFRKDLTSAEKRMVEWAAAFTILHEVIHAITYIAPGNHITPEQNLCEDTPPPFFDQEPLAEAGFSFEAALNGGICKAFVLSKSGLPYGHWFETFWPTVEAQELCASEAITLTNPDPFLYQELFPIPVSFYDDMQQKGFWDGIVKRYGHQLFRFRFVNEGARINFALEESIETPILFQATTHTRLPRGNSHLELTSANLRDRWGKVNELRNLQGISQHDRQVEVFPQLFLASSKTENNFWNQMQNQNLSANLIIQEILRANTSVQEQTERLAQLVELVSTIVLNHEKTVDLLVTGHPPQEPDFHKIQAT